MELIAVFIFYDQSAGKQSKLAFSDKYRHCNIFTFDGADWIMLDFDRTGFLTRKLKSDKGAHLVNTLKKHQSVTAVISVMVEERTKFLWKPFIVRSCNEICRYTSGVDIGWTFNPTHLLDKLLKYNNKRNYHILNAWRRDYGVRKQQQLNK